MRTAAEVIAYSIDNLEGNPPGWSWTLAQKLIADLRAQGWDIVRSDAETDPSFKLPPRDEPPPPVLSIVR